MAENLRTFVGLDSKKPRGWVFGGSWTLELASLQISWLPMMVSRTRPHPQRSRPHTTLLQGGSLGDRGWGWCSPPSSLKEKIFSWASQQPSHYSSFNQNWVTCPSLKPSRGKENGIIMLGIGQR